MPGPGGKPLDEEIRRGRQVFFGRLASEAGDAAARLDQAYQARLVSIERSIRQWEQSATGGDRGLMALENLRASIQKDLDDLQDAVVDVSAHLQANGAEQGYRTGLAALQRGAVNVAFHLPTLETIQAGIAYVDSEAWRAAVGRLGAFHAQNAADLVLDAIARGVNPRQTAVWLRDYFVKSQRPMADALRMARTTQLYAAREGTRQIYERTGVEEWIWSANLGNPRTCLSCIALHGTVHPVRDILNDHHNGRCAPIPVTPRWRDLGFSGGSDVEVETGINWFMRQSMDLQQQIMGPGMFAAWSAGEFRLEQVPRLYHSDVFGPMWRKSTLRELLQGGDPGGLGPVPEPSGGPGGPLDDLAAVRAANRMSYERAKAITPAMLEAGETDGSLGEFMYNFFAYDDQGNPVFDAEMVDHTRTDLFYNVYTLGRGHVNQDLIDDVREKAGALLAADDWLGVTLTAKERNLLAQLASADDLQALAAIDQVRDRRLKGAIAYREQAAQNRGQRYDTGFVSAADEDGAARLREMRMPAWMAA